MIFQPYISRRHFLKTSAAVTGGTLLMGASPLFAHTATDMTHLNISIFSKHLQFLNYQNMAEAAKEMGFDGVDLTVRPKGHVLPENVEVDLPQAVKALIDYGLPPNLFSSAIANAKDSLQQKVLKTAAAQGFKIYRTNWLKYTNQRSIEEDLTAYNQQLKELGDLNKKLNVSGAYQNHAGISVGSPVWDLKPLLKDISPENMGIQYDIRHATVEGAHSWELGFELIKDQINSLVLKDFKWGLVDGKWKVINTPIGEGMVDFKRFFSLLKHYKINVPVSLHLEYDLGGAHTGRSKISIPQQEVFKHMKQDLHHIKKLWNEA